MVILAKPDIEETNCRQQLRIFWICVKSISINFQCILVILYQLVHLPKFKEGVLIGMQLVRLQEALDGILKLSHISVAQSFVKVYLPVFDI